MALAGVLCSNKHTSPGQYSKRLLASFRVGKAKAEPHCVLECIHHRICHGSAKIARHPIEFRDICARSKSERRISRAHQPAHDFCTASEASFRSVITCFLAPSFGTRIVGFAESDQLILVLSGLDDEHAGRGMISLHHAQHVCSEGLPATA